MKISSIGFNYSLVPSKKLAIVVLHISKSLYHTFNGSYIFVKLLDFFLSNIRLKSILLEIYFIKKKQPISIESRVGQLFIESPS